MITELSHTTIWVLDQDEARAFYTGKLGFDVVVDERMDGFRWLTVSPPGSDHQLILLEPGPPMMDAETAEQVRSSPRACSGRACCAPTTARARTRSCASVG